MKLVPLFFLPKSWFIWAYYQAEWERLMDFWVVRLLFSQIDNLGVTFPYKGDVVIWLWPWKRTGVEGDKWAKAPYISLSFTGTGDFGDARFWTLQELDELWDKFAKYMNQQKDSDPFI